MSEKGQNEADPDGGGVFTRPHSSPPQHRPGHGGALRHHESHHHRGASQHRGLARPHGGPRHPREFQDNQDDRAFSHHAPREAHHPTSLGLSPSRSIAPSHHSYSEDSSDDDQYHGNRPPHHGGPHRHAEPDPHGGPHRHAEPSHHGGPHRYAEPDPHGGPHRHAEPSHHGGSHRHAEPDPHGGPHRHAEPSHHGGPHRHAEPPHHGGPHRHVEDGHRGGLPHHGEPSYREEFHHKHARPHHHDSSPHRRHPRYGDNVSCTSLDGDPRHRDYLWSPSDQSVPGTSQGSSSLSHPATPHAHVHRWSSGHSTAPSHVAGSSKVCSQESSSKDSESYTEDNEQLRKRKTRRTPRSRKKLQLENCFQWWYEKLIVLFHGLQRMLWKLTHCLAFETFIFLVVCLNTIMLVAQTFAEVEIRGEWHFLILDCIFLCIYMVEALLKIIALGFSYFHDFWNNLDFCIMMVAVLDFTLMQLNPLSYSFYHQSLFRILKVFKSMRALRAIRVLRRLSFLTSLHEVTGTLARSLPSITAIFVLMFTCLFLFSVVLRALFRKSDPKRFQNIFSTLFTLFTMLTLDDWSLIYMDNRAQGAWYIIPILMVYIIIQYFIFLNLVIAVLVDNFQMALLKGLEKVRQERAARIQENLLDDSLTELRQAEPKEIRSEGTMQKQLLEKKFGTLTEKQRQLLFQFLQLVAGVEQQQQKFRSQASVIDEIVDTAFEAGEEDFRK
uniref:Cation channel sperm-associated protein 1 n=1 Tax=Oryctolagus cuniculus TaxID=9986 RepID=A0A5F9DT16_RABIT